MSAGLSDAADAVEAPVDLSEAYAAGCAGRAAGQQRWDGKRWFDFHVALVGLLLLSPLIVTVVIAILLRQGRPVVIRNRRIGRAGVPFPCYKFRTMVRDADAVLAAVLATDARRRAEWDERRKLRDDPRVTALGRVLRESSVDEIPQLFNVLLGHMSLVGPRPIVADEVPLYGVSIGHYYRVRPGLTGAWQIGGRSDVSFARRVELDTAYVATRSFRSDMLILAKTVPAVLKRQGSR